MALRQLLPCSSERNGISKVTCPCSDSTSRIPPSPQLYFESLRREHPAGRAAAVIDTALKRVTDQRQAVFKVLGDGTFTSRLFLSQSGAPVGACPQTCSSPTFVFSLC